MSVVSLETLTCSRTYQDFFLFKLFKELELNLMENSYHLI